jgi:hypothetical protein
MTRYQLELASQISMLRTMHFNLPFETVVERITEFYKQKLDIYQKFTSICSALIAGPKPNVDYGELASEPPKLNATLEYIDQSLFKLSPLVFATLIDMREDSQGHANHLIITKAERAKLFMI